MIIRSLFQPMASRKGAPEGSWLAGMMASSPCDRGCLSGGGRHRKKCPAQRVGPWGGQGARLGGACRQGGAEASLCRTVDYRRDQGLLASGNLPVEGGFFLRPRGCSQKCTAQVLQNFDCQIAADRFIAVAGLMRIVEIGPAPLSRMVRALGRPWPKSLGGPGLWLAAALLYRRSRNWDKTCLPAPCSQGRRSVSL